jgi:hypothetical protein
VVAQPSPRCPRIRISSLSADDVRLILAQLDGDDLINARLACNTFHDLSLPPAVKHRHAYLRTPALAAYAWEALPAFTLARSLVLWERLQLRFDLDSASTALHLMCARSTARAASSEGGGSLLAEPR